MRATYPLYITEQSPTQIRGFLTTAYMLSVTCSPFEQWLLIRNSWYVSAQIFAPLALRQLAITDPYDFNDPIYTQWGMLATLLIIIVFLPESPCEPNDTGSHHLKLTKYGVAG